MRRFSTESEPPAASRPGAGVEVSQALETGGNGSLGPSQGSVTERIYESCSACIVAGMAPIEKGIGGCRLQATFWLADGVAQPARSDGAGHISLPISYIDCSLRSPNSRAKHPESN